jgi:hypothetical protein
MPNIGPAFDRLIGTGSSASAICPDVPLAQVREDARRRAVS